MLIGVIYDLFKGNNNFASIGFIVFEILILLIYGIRYFIKNDKWLTRIFGVLLIVQLILIVIMYISMKFVIESNDTFGIGLIFYLQLAIFVASSLSYGLYRLLRPVFEKPEYQLYRGLLFCILVTVYIVTHLLIVPNNAYVPATTYILSIIIFVGLFGLIHFILYKVMNIKYEVVLFVYSIMLMIVQAMSFDIQLVLLYPLQILILGHLYFQVFKKAKNSYVTNWLKYIVYEKIGNHQFAIFL